MADKKFLVNLDMNSNEVIKMKLQNLATAPSGWTEGMVYWDTTEETLYIKTSTGWRDMGSDTAYSHPAYTVRNVDTSGAEILDTFTSDATGHVTGITTRTLTLANLGYTGASNANYYVHPNHSGQVTSTADGATVLTVSAITAQTALTSGLASTDELLVNDGGIIKRMDISVLETYMEANLTDTFIGTGSVTYETLSANGDVGTTAGTLAIGDHTHSGVYEPANANIQTHISSVSNPHGVDKADVSLGNVTNDAQLKIASNLADLNNRQTALNTLAAVSGAIDGQVLIKEAGTGNVAWATPSSGVTDHTLLSNIGTNTHAQIDTHIADTSNPHDTAWADLLTMPDWTSYFTDGTGETLMSQTIVINRSSERLTFLRGNQIAIKNIATVGSNANAILQFEDSDSAAYWYIGCYTTAQALNYGYLGNDYNDAVMKWVNGYIGFHVPTSDAPTQRFQVGLSDLVIPASGRVLINTTTDDSTNQLQVNGGIASSGTITATTFSGSGASLTGITDDAAIHDNVANEIDALTEKTTPSVNDIFIIEDSAASGVKKKIKYSNIAGSSAFVGLTDTPADYTGNGSNWLRVNSGATALEFVSPPILPTTTSVSSASWVLDEDTMSSNSATKVPTQQSVKTYVDTQVSSALASEMSWKGAYNASTDSPSLDTTPSGVKKGDTYYVTVAGSFFDTYALKVGDMLVANIDDADALAEWTIVPALSSVPDASTSTKGLIELSTSAEVITGTDTVRAVTPSTLKSWAEQTGKYVTRKYAVSVGNGSLTTITVSHNLGTSDVTVMLYDNTTKDVIECEMEITDSNTVTLKFNTAPTASQYRCVVIG